MSEHVIIEDLGEKIELLIRSEKTPIGSNSDLLIKINVSKDWLSRIKSGHRQLSEDRFISLCTAFGIPQKTWYLSLIEFGGRLGFSRHEVYKITQKYVPGIDFGSRIKDAEMIESVFCQIEGYWESFYYSASKLTSKVVSHDFLHVSRVNEDGFIECEIIDFGVSYIGWCFPMKAHLYFILEKKEIFNEIIVYCTNLPDRPHPRLFGVILCLSGGIDEHHTNPAAAKCVFRYIGKDEGVRKLYNLSKKENVRDFLIEKNKKGPYYIDPNDPNADSDMKQIVQDISNVVTPEQIPSVLRMVK